MSKHNETLRKSVKMPCSTWRLLAGLGVLLMAGPVFAKVETHPGKTLSAMPVPAYRSVKGTAADCIEACEADSECVGFSRHKEKGICSLVDVPSAAVGTKSDAQFDYYEKTALDAKAHLEVLKKKLWQVAKQLKKELKHCAERDTCKKCKQCELLAKERAALQWKIGQWVKLLPADEAEDIMKSVYAVGK